MVLGVVFQCYLICHAGCHRYGAQSGCSDQRVDFLLCEEVEQLDEEDAARYGKGECKEASDYDTDCREVQERLGCHGRADR